MSGIFYSSDDKRINNNSKTEKLLPSNIFASFDELEIEDNASFTIENEKIEIHPNSFLKNAKINSISIEELEISNEISNENENAKENSQILIHIGNNSNSSSEKFIKIGSKSLSSIRNYKNFNSDSSQDFLKKLLNSMIALETTIVEKKRRELNLVQEENIVTEEEEKVRIINFKKITYKRKKPTNYFLSKYSSYCIIKCEIITTFFLDNYVWSIFSNPKLKEKDSNMRVRFVILNKKNMQFEVDEHTVDNLELDDNLLQKNIDRGKFKEFILGVEKFFTKPDFLLILKNNKRKKVVNLSKCFLCLILMVCIIIFSIMDKIFNYAVSEPSVADEDNSNFWLKILFFILFIGILILLIVKYLYCAIVEVAQLKLSQILDYHVKNFKNVEEYFENWNVEFWIPHGISVGCPVSLDYIQFNLDPFIDIELQHHEISILN